MEGDSSAASDNSRLLSLITTGHLPARSVHEQMWQLSMATQQSLAAATCQCLGVAALCIALSSLAWIALETNVPLHLLKRSEYWAVIIYFGVPTRLQSQLWLNETQSTEIVILSSDQWVFVDVMMGICYLSVLVGFIAFLLDFIEIKKLGVARLIIATVLHILSAILCALVLVFCSWILTIIQKPSVNNLLNKHYYVTSLGVSFYLTIAAFIFASLASIFSVWSMKVYGKDLLPSQRVGDSETKETNRFGPGAQQPVLLF
ncbi:transmembrane protein 127-like [Mauremys mutica]|uniref:Transmembrane protein 127 transmembrane region domain-containing protein n=1 Tax=Mauremys mutica TaxID=74926 RepID=A0A9D4AT84_9SAUR|nr:transmembrane protein 127-like [Mauremys mutica]KAH1169933.1 hypothetical protein KIL84_000918 [Mauremys mutica]